MTTSFSRLDADQLAKLACDLFVFDGRNQTTGRLIFRALELDAHHPGALRSLSDFLDQHGTEVFSGVVLEYSLSGELVFAEKPRRVLEDLRFLCMWTWGFSRHVSGSTDLGQSDFHNKSDFVVDEERYQEFLASVVGPAGSLRRASEVAKTLCGAMCAALLHKERGTEIGIDACFQRDSFELTVEYLQWLESDVEPLELHIADLHKRMGSKYPDRRWWQD